MNGNGEIKKCEKDCVLKNSKGLHARPATLFVQAALKFQSEITVCNMKNQVSGDAKSVMSMLMLAAPCDTPVRITAYGPDADEAVQTLLALIEQGFNDD